MRVLVIDDEPAVRRALRRALEIKGHEVKEAQDGLDGLDVWKSWQPEVVYLDVLMPGLSGPEVLAEMGGQPQARVILMSAYMADYSIEKVRELGASFFEAKPFEDIFAVVARAEELINGPVASSKGQEG